MRLAYLHEVSDITCQAQGAVVAMVLGVVEVSVLH